MVSTYLGGELVLLVGEPGDEALHHALLLLGCLQMALQLLDLMMIAPIKGVVKGCLLGYVRQKVAV